MLGWPNSKWKRVFMLLMLAIRAGAVAVVGKNARVDLADETTASAGLRSPRGRHAVPLPLAR